MAERPSPAPPGLPGGQGPDQELTGTAAEVFAGFGGTGDEVTNERVADGEPGEAGEPAEPTERAERAGHGTAGEPKRHVAASTAFRISPARPSEVRPAGPPGPGLEPGATAPQLRRFIKSRAYVPMHELRRRFGINGGDDDVTPLEVGQRRVYVGLPQREGRLLGELLRGGDIGVELSLDPITPIVVGVYPMRPIPRS